MRKSLEWVALGSHLAPDQVLLLFLLQGFHARACESQKRVVIIMSRREQDGIEAKVRDRDDVRLKREEMRHSDELPRWVCMGLD